MLVAAARLTLHLPESRSLKDHRQVARSLSARIRNKFNVSVAEDADTDLWQRLTLLVCAASNEAAHANAMITQVAAFVEETRPDLEILDCQVELISGL